MLRIHEYEFAHVNINKAIKTTNQAIFILMPCLLLCNRSLYTPLGIKAGT